MSFTRQQADKAIACTATCAALLLSSPCLALQDTLEHSLDGYIEYALANNPEIMAARSSVFASQQDIRLAAALPDPMVMGRVEITDGLMPASAGISQMIMQPATLVLERKSARYKKEAEDARVNQAMADVVYKVRSAYFMLYETGQLLAIRQRNLALLRQYEELTRSAYATGAVAQSSLLKAGLEKARLEDEIKSDELKSVSQRRELAAALGKSETVEFPYPEFKPVLEIANNPDSIVQLVFNQNPELLAMRREVLSGQVMSASAKTRFLPDFAVGIEYMRRTSSVADEMPNDSWMWSPSVSLSVPLWFGKKVAAVRKAGAMAVKMEQQTLSMQNMVAAEAAGLCYELQDAGRKRKLLTDVLVPQAKQMLALMENEYRTGMSRSLDVLDGQRMLLELEMENLMEQTRELNIRAALLRLLGDNGKGTAQ